MYANKIRQAVAAGDAFVRVFTSEPPRGGGQLLAEGLLDGDGIGARLAGIVANTRHDIRVEKLSLERALAAHAGNVAYAEETGRL